MPSDTPSSGWRPRRLKLRSRVGCTRCKERHQKCDELRPACSRCFRAGQPCDYEKSSRHPQSPRTRSEGDLVHSAKGSTLPPTVGCNAQGLPCADAFQGQLLMYFIYEASAAISCHESLQQDTCQALISVGSAVPCLWYSALLFSALHRASSSRPVGEVSDDLDLKILALRSKLLASLQSTIQNRRELYDEAILATTLMLTMAEIHFEPEGGSWRTHWLFMKQAKEACDQPSDLSPQDASLTRFVRRRFGLLDFLTSLPTSPRHTPRAISDPTLPQMDEIGVIDGTLACCADLVSVYRCIDQLRGQRSLGTSESSHAAVAGMARSLLAIIQAMMVRDQETPPHLSSEINGVSDHQLTEYRLCNRAAQHMALICVHRHLLDEHSVSPRIQESVRNIVQIAEAVSGHSILSPAICLTTPLFVAGCSAEQPEQDQIAALLETQYKLTGSRNTRRTIEVLKGIWSTSSSHDGLRLTKALDSATGPADFLPY